MKNSMVLLRCEKEAVQPSNSFRYPKLHTLVSRVVRDGGAGNWDGAWGGAAGGGGGARVS